MITEKYPYTELKKGNYNGSRKYITPTGEKLPSITNKKFTEILSEYASDCSDFINKIKDKDSINYFFEKKEKEFKGNFESKDAMLEDIVNYYNSNCG